MDRLARPPSKIHLLLLDCLIIFLEILLTTIAYETALSGESPSFSSNTTQSNPNTPIIEPSSPFGDRPENSNGEWAASQYIVDVRLSSIFERLRSPPPPPPVQDESDGDLLPLPNTTPWRLSSTLRFVMQARTRTGERERQRETAEETSGTIPGGLDVNERT